VKGMIEMFKCYDYVVGEIIEAYEKSILLEEINERFVNYNEESKQGHARCLCVKGVYYIVMM
jgi:hypothetical protein